MKKQDIDEEIRYFNSLNGARADREASEAEIFQFAWENLSDILKKGKGLEGGCGGAFFGRRIISIRPAISLVGVDLNRGFVERINRLKIPRYKAICGNLENKKAFAGGEFDFVVLPYVLHHIPNYPKIIDNAHYWLKNGGILIILDPNAENPILKISYSLRNLLAGIFKNSVSKCASKNEKNVPVKPLLNLVSSKFEILVLKNFMINSRSQNYFLPAYVNLLSGIRKMLLKLIAVFSFGNIGSDILLVARKIY